MFRRQLVYALGLAAAFGLQGIPQSHVVPPMSITQGTGRRTKAPRRALARRGAPLPGKKGTPQKYQGKTCRHRKRARARRRAMCLKRG